MDQGYAIASIAGRLRDQAAIRALYLAGSFGVGLEDKYSDIDFVAVAPEGDTEVFRDLWRDTVGRLGEIVYWSGPQKGLVNAITADWLRIDVVILTAEQLARRPRHGLKVLFDHDGLWTALRTRPEPAPPAAAKLKSRIDDVLRILGLLSLAIGREEYLIGITGAFFLRGHLIDLLIDETAAPERGGMLHLNRQITAEQKALLLALPPFEPARDAVIAAYLALAAAYLPRARREAARLGVEWPDRFEAATWAHLKRSLGIEPPALRQP